MESGMSDEGEAMGNQDPEDDLQTKGEGCGDTGRGLCEGLRVRKMKLPTVVEKNSDTVWDTMTFVFCGGDVSVMKALRSILRWRTTSWRKNRSAWWIRGGPMHMSKWNTSVGVHNRGVAWDTPMAKWV